MAQTYAVGGSVRDQLLGRKPKDHDYVIVGTSAEEMLAQGHTPVGVAFPVFLINGCEYALARTEKKCGVGYGGFTVNTKDVTLEEDLLRRDLTINAMAHPVGVEFDINKVIDPYGGIKDLERKVLRHTSDAFAEDPLRVLRVARFAARYDGFVVHPSTLELMRQVAPELKHIHGSRIVVELEKGFGENSPKRMLDILDDVDAPRHNDILRMFGADKENVFEPPIDWIDHPSLIPSHRAGAVMQALPDQKSFPDVIPGSWIQVYNDMCLHSQALIAYDRLSAHQRIELIDKMKGLHNLTRIMAVYGILDARNIKTAEPGLIYTDIEKIKAINMAEALTGIPPKDIAVTVQKLKINALYGPIP